MSIITSSLFISGCQKDLYDPNYVASKDAPITGIPADFDWSTISSVNLTVNVDDQYYGQYYYVVEVFDKDPSLNSNATLLTKGIAKKGEAFSNVFSVPKTLKSVFIRQTNPAGECVTRAVGVASTISLDFGLSTKSVSSNVTSKKTDDVTYTDVVFPLDINTNTSYTYAMEDLWPNYGDYDMNDIVVSVTLASQITGNGKVNKMTITANLEAIGANKALGAAFQLDNIPAEKIHKVTYSTEDSRDGSIFEVDSEKNIELGQNNAVIPLFDNAHKFLKTSGITNTIVGGNSASPRSVTVEIDFVNSANNHVSQSDIDISNLNFFIVTGVNQKTKKRTEIHLRGYSPTDKADTSLFGTGDDNSISGAKYSSKGNLVWGIMIPAKFAYPIEDKSIVDAYKDFYNWATKGDSYNDWYNSPVKGLTY